jgi:hypothetical protein
MKKIVLSIVGAAVIGIAAMNVNLALQGEKGTNLTLAGLFSLADNESEDIPEGCKTVGTTCSSGYWEGNAYHETSATVTASCDKGSDSTCGSGSVTTNYDGNGHVTSTTGSIAIVQCK